MVWMGRATPCCPLGGCGHLHLHVPVHISRQGGAIEHKVIHHHVQRQPWPPVGHGLVQSARWLPFRVLLLGTREVRPVLDRPACPSDLLMGALVTGGARSLLRA